MRSEDRCGRPPLGVGEGLLKPERCDATSDAPLMQYKALCKFLHAQFSFWLSFAGPREKFENAAKFFASLGRGLD